MSKVLRTARKAEANAIQVREFSRHQAVPYKEPKVLELPFCSGSPVHSMSLQERMCNIEYRRNVSRMAIGELERGVPRSGGNLSYVYFHLQCRGLSHVCSPAAATIGLSTSFLSQKYCPLLHWPFRLIIHHLGQQANNVMFESLRHQTRM